jgi:cob(I)alamin adenosyltransferase
MKRPRIYTRTGDGGSTSLYGGERVPKHHPRLEVYGKLDELQAALGLLLVVLDDAAGAECVRGVQNDLFDIGADLATPVESSFRQRLPRLVDQEDCRRLERWIDRYNALAPPMRGFILPGGTEAAARAHLARTICRSAERALAELMSAEEIRPENLVYLNRLSDFLFVVARWLNARNGEEEMLWRKRERGPGDA